MDVPVQGLVGLRTVGEAATAVVQVSGDDRHRVAAHQNAVVVEPEPSRRQLEQEVVDVVQRSVQRVVEILG